MILVVSISQSRCLSFQGGGLPSTSLFPSFVSISQSRCLSFQVPAGAVIRLAIGFNLAIEMLVISGNPSEWNNAAMPQTFQSRNRDACHFRTPATSAVAVKLVQVSISQSRCLSFQGIAMLILVSAYLSFQSRNRDACHFRRRRAQCDRTADPRFNLAIEMLVISGVSQSFGSVPPDKFQSRNRDACHFRATATPADAETSHSFNLAIEMLVISGRERFARPRTTTHVSISQSRCLSFQGVTVSFSITRVRSVSISQSRCLSFQV